MPSQISIHALLAESDGGSGAGSWPRRIFLSTLSLRRATFVLLTAPNRLLRFLSTLSLRRATRLPTALRTPHHNFYPRSPCGERRRTKTILAEIRDFYPRSPCGERPVPGGGHVSETDFYPRSPCGERPVTVNIPIPLIIISIHALLAESDLWWGVRKAVGSLFLSTLSLRRATRSRL